MEVSRLKEIINDLDDNVEIFIRNTSNPLGNIDELVQVELSTYSSFGIITPCVILNTYNSAPTEKDLEENVNDFVNNQKNK